MSRRTLLALLGSLAALAVLVGVAWLGERPAGRDEALLFPGLKERLNDIQRIVVTGPGNEVIATLERGAEQWAVAERDNHPADTARIRQNLLALADARIVEEKTSNPEFYARLGVQDLDDEEAGGLGLTLSGTTEIASVIIGQAQAGGGPDYRYARRSGEAASWLITGEFNLGKTGGEWLDRRLTDIPAERIASVTIDHPGQGRLEIVRRVAGADSDAESAAADFEIRDIPAGRKPSYPGVANTIGAALADLQLEDVQPRDSLGSAPGNPIVARFVTTDGLTVETSAWQRADGLRITFLASGEGDAAKEADEINARLGGWVYTLPAYKSEQLTRRMTDLLAPS